MKDWKPRFQTQQLVKGRILGLDPETKRVEMTFRSGDLNKPRGTNLSLSDITPGQIIEGTVKRVEEYGLFIQIEGSKLSGLCHKSEVCPHSKSLTTPRRLYQIKTVSSQTIKIAIPLSLYVGSAKTIE